ncbi:MAG: CBS domain-containing protein, partial [Bacteroidetes bacterium]|nr:CBS domain-containing protein [Bacteroidota bacterium]
TARITKEEGIFAGNSAGSAMAGLVQLIPNLKEDDLVVVIFHDHGTRYLGKMFNEDWMREKGFFQRKGQTAKDVVSTMKHAEIKSIELKEPIEKAVKIMRENDFSQMPVTNNGRIVGSINELQLFDCLIHNPDNKTSAVETIMQPAFPFVDISTPIESLSSMLTPANPAVMVREFTTDSNFIITRHDIIKALC